MHKMSSLLLDSANILIIQPLIFVKDWFFIEILDKFITYIVCLYKTLCEVSPVTVSLFVTLIDTGPHNRRDLIQSLVPTHCECNGYIYISFKCYAM